jgi:hypothetical protein
VPRGCGSYPGEPSPPSARTNQASSWQSRLAASVSVSAASPTRPRSSRSRWTATPATKIETSSAYSAGWPSGAQATVARALPYQDPVPRISPPCAGSARRSRCAPSGRVPLPCHRRLALVGDPDAGQVVGPHPGGPQRRFRRLGQAAPDLLWVVLDSAGIRAELPEHPGLTSDDLAVFRGDCCVGPRGPLIDREHVPPGHTDRRFPSVAPAWNPIVPDRTPCDSIATR